MNDNELGMNRRITRRDFLDGVALTAGALAAGSILGPGTAQAAAGKPHGVYPPALLGMRGSHTGSFEVAHALRSGSFWNTAGTPQDTGEAYDLVVVGAGISGLSAAHFYLRDVNPNAKILILDPHDDFGGHAKRNEFRVKGKTLIGYGGSQSIDSPSTYPPEAKQLLSDVGIDVNKFYEYFDRDFYKRNGAGGRAVFFSKEQWGRDHLVVGGAKMADRLADAPMDAESKRQLSELFDTPTDYLAGLSSEQKVARLSRLTYGQFLQQVAGVTGDAYRYMLRSTAGGAGVNIDQFSALEAAAQGYTGMRGLNLDFSGEPWPGLSHTGKRFWYSQDPYIFHFPDGNASVARALVRKLIPAALPGGTMEDLVTSVCDYSKLDQQSSRTRIRLNSTVVRATQQEVLYVSGGRLMKVRTGGVVLACWNAMIPYIAPELSEAQKAAGREAVKYPMMYANVALSNWRAWHRLGVNSISFPDGYWPGASLDFPVSMGSYRFNSSPDDPILVHFGAGLTEPGMSPQAGARAGRVKMFSASFADLERGMRDSLNRVLGPSGFNPARDIRGITINRWAHGYARYYGLPFDAAFWPEGPTPADIIGTPVGRITVACTDQAAHGFVDGAIESAYRAVRHLGGQS
ncbi:NAD(P)-binding protein [Streptosporangium sp. CA-115845]|uniref:NAD(P)-binding protein n=1 Tax=Streptosporangium sp. CA-115845 TaxID=3240071 RepID=UPI003D8BE5F1